jgi:hypothetical protein
LKILKIFLKFSPSFLCFFSFFLFSQSSFSIGVIASIEAIGVGEEEDGKLSFLNKSYTKEEDEEVKKWLYNRLMYDSSFRRAFL